MIHYDPATFRDDLAGVLAEAHDPAGRGVPAHVAAEVAAAVAAGMRRADDPALPPKVAAERRYVAVRVNALHHLIQLAAAATDPEEAALLRWCTARYAWGLIAEIVAARGTSTVA
jgi:hypothetical protein